MKRKTKLRIGAVMAAVAMTFVCIGGISIDTSYAVEQETTKVSELESMFTTLDLMDATIYELQEAMEEGRVTSQELVQMYLDRIEAYDDELDLNSIITINEDALEQAAELDAERAAGNVRGPLHGIPIIVKDNYDVEGLATTAGATALLDSIANDDADVIAALEEAGAIIIAKSNLSEFAFSGANSRSSVGGTVHNAYDTTRTAAGSSGGTAVAITSNFAAAGLGTDTGSSIRRPSSFSNLYGLRPSKGLTSIDGVVPLNADQDVTGPMARTVEDLAIMLDAMAGTSENDSYTVDADADSLIPEGGYVSYLNADGLEGKRIGYLTNSFGYYVSTSIDEDGNVVSTVLEEPVELDEKIQAMVEQTLATFEAGGATLVDLSDIITEELIYSLNYAVNSVSLSGSSAFEWDMYEYFLDLGENATMHSVYDIIQDGGYISDLSWYGTPIDQLVNPRYDLDGNATAEYEAQWAARLAFRNTITEILEEYDIDAVVFVSQTDIASLETESDTVTNNNSAGYLNKFGPVAGLPEMMIPMGFAETDEENGVTEAMPLGISMFAGYGQDATLIEIAYSYEQLAGDDIRQQPSSLPALPDEELNEFLAELVADSIELSSETADAAALAVLEEAVAAAEAVDTTDVEAVYEVAYALAEAYDAVSGTAQAGSSASDAADAADVADIADTEDAADTASEETSSDAPAVGDPNMLAMWAVLAAVSAAAGSTLVIRRKKYD